jgi:hypothetical protein
VTFSALSWLDHDERERRRMVEVINLFREKGTLDELGIGTIRDTFADGFFPGTSTIQTRARYFLFIPWIYTGMERELVSSRDAAKQARSRQTRLVQSLKAGGEGANDGVIGIDAGEHLQRLPSAIYWNGLGRWGVRAFPGSVERYHESLDTFYRQERARKTSDGGELVDEARRNWQRNLPPAPDGLLEQTSFTLSPDEAQFLIERIQSACAGSLLAQGLSWSRSRLRRTKHPWDVADDPDLPEALRRDLAHARNFSLVMEGAALLYNLQMAERSVQLGMRSDDTLIEHYRQEMERWATEMQASASEIARWDLGAFWARVREMNPRLPAGAIAFCHLWIESARAMPGEISQNLPARDAIARRERTLKGSLARLSNPRALERWSGGSGLGRLTYRWDNARRIMVDILNGLHTPSGHN